MTEDDWFQRRECLIHYETLREEGMDAHGAQEMMVLLYPNEGVK